MTQEKFGLVGSKAWKVDLFELTMIVSVGSQDGRHQGVGGSGPRHCRRSIRVTPAVPLGATDFNLITSTFQAFLIGCVNFFFGR
jgi:hypothetical protein